MPKPSKGTEIVKLLLSQASKDMREPLVPMAMPALAAHLSDVEFMYSDNKYYELCGQMGHLIGPSGIGKDQLHDLVEAIMRSFRDHDDLEYKKLENWQHVKNTKGDNKAIAIPSATLLKQKDVEQLSIIHSQLSIVFHMYPDSDLPGERLFLQLQKVLPSLVHHQLPLGCKDFSEYYLNNFF